MISLSVLYKTCSNLLQRNKCVKAMNFFIVKIMVKVLDEIYISFIKVGVTISASAFLLYLYSSSIYLLKVNLCRNNEAWEFSPYGLFTFFIGLI